MSDVPTSGAVPQKERLQLALEACKSNQKSMRKVAKQYVHLDVFAPLATTYKHLVQANTSLVGAYSMHKVDFLKLYQEARAQTIRPEVIISAWEKAGLRLYDLGLVWQHKSERQILPS